MFIKQMIKRILPKSLYSVLKKIKTFFKEKFLIIKYNLVQKKLLKIQKSLKKKQKLSVGFYVVYDSSWGARPLYEKMQGDSTFFTKIVVCPDVARGIENEKQILNQVYERLSKKYGSENVLLSYDNKQKKYIDYSDLFDIINLSNPYDEMTIEFYQVKYLNSKNKLCFYNSYGYQGKLRYDIDLMKSDTFNLFWRLFVDNQATKEIAINEQYIKGKNVIVSGCCKMDDFHITTETKDNSSRYVRTVIIAPHHTVDQSNLNLSNFLLYADFFKELPLRYPQIKFIFRPHPLLFTKLRREDFWGEKKVSEYIEQITSNKNLVYSTEGEYFDVFNESDALIDDCGSFLAEYFYTGKPQCYMLRSKEQFDTEYLDFGKKFFDYVYKAFSKEDIIHFIDDVVLNKNDPLKDSRLSFAKKEVMINYPDVSDFIIKYFKELMK